MSATGPVVDLSQIDPKVLGLLVAFHVASYLVYRGKFGDRLAPGKQSSIAAICTQCTTGLCYACFTTWFGMQAWYGGELDAIGGSARGRLYGHSETFEKLMVATAVYETYNTVLVCFMPEYRTVAFIGHHVTTCLLALFGSYPFLNYYGIFFFGVASISSVPLCLIDVAAALEAKAMHTALNAVFAVLFLVFRTAYWPYVSYGFWSDALSALRGEIPGVQAHSPPAYLVFLAANIGLTGLQWLWTSRVLQGIVDAVSPPAVASKGKAS
jgi:hypothetical protein